MLLLKEDLLKGVEHPNILHLTGQTMKGKVEIKLKSECKERCSHHSKTPLPLADASEISTAGLISF